MSFFKTKKCDMAYAINDIYTGMMTTLISNNNKKKEKRRSEPLKIDDHKRRKFRKKYLVFLRCQKNWVNGEPG